MIKNIFNRKLLGGIGVISLVAVLGLVVWRVGQNNPTLIQPKAYGNGVLHACRFIRGVQPISGKNVLCEPNAASNQRVNLYSMLGGKNFIGYQTIQPAGWDGLSRVDDHTLGIDVLSGYNVQSLVCDDSTSGKGYLCYDHSTKVATCRMYASDSCPGTTPAKVTQGNDAVFNITGSQDNVSTAYADVYFEFYTDNNICWNPQPVPTGGMPQGLVQGTNPTLTWQWNKTWSSTINSVMVYLWEGCNPSTCDAKYQAQIPSPYTSASLSNFGITSLKANTQYWWKVNPNSYFAQDSAHDCMPIWTFNTGICDTGYVSCSTGCANLQTDPKNCSSCGNVCASGTCTAGVCGTVLTHLECQSNSCVSVTGAGSNTGGCTTAGTSCGTTVTTHLECQNNACVSVTGTGSNTGGCTTAGASCLITTGQCLVPSQTHLECINSACVRKVGAGSNLNGCTSVGASCSTNTTCSSDSGCATDKVCQSGQCVTPSCSLTPTVCQTIAYTNHTCSLTNKTDGTSCSDTSTEINIASGGVCQTNGTTTSKCKCTSNSTCATGMTCTLYTGRTYGECTTSSQSNEVNACWGNGGTNGKCYDCNADGVINILDFQCFRVRYGTTITP